ncbi:hypothetical protein A6A25_38640 [Saccharothrix sp. CB00851]|nr:hypothetical protein A6A25_38640 [Saccharothrix sp. CB00851]
MAAATATFLVMLDGTAVVMALPGLRAELDIDFSGQQWVVAAHVAPLAVFLLTAGALADRFGHRSAFRLGALLFTAGSVAAGAAGTLPVLATARAFQGVGSAFLLAAASTLAAHVFPGPARGRAVRLLSTAAVLGLAFGPVVGGLLAEVDWRLVFLSVLPAGVMLQAIGKTQLRAVPPIASNALDWPGFTLSGACVALVVLGLLRGQALGWTSTPILAMFTAATFLLFVFLLAQRARGDKAMLELALFGNRAFLGVSLTTFVSAAIGLATVFLTTLHLQATLGYSPLITGACLLPLAVALIGAALATRGLVTKIPPGIAVGTSVLLITIGAGLLGLITPDSTWLGVLPSTLLVGAGMGMGTPLRHNLFARALDPAKAGTASRINETSHHLGLTVGIAGLGALFQYRFITGLEQEGITAAARTAMTTGIVRQASAASLGFVAITCVAVGAVFVLIAFTYVQRHHLHGPATCES